jgi:uncharacterized protein
MADEVTIRVVRSFSEIKPAEWELLSGASRSGPGYNPFTSHAFLSALEDSGSATAETGWAIICCSNRKGASSAPFRVI